MKKLLAIMLSFVMVFSLASCGGGSQTEGAAEPEEEVIEEELQYPGNNENFKYNVYDKHVEIIGYCGKPNKEELVVPATIEDLPVTEITRAENADYVDGIFGEFKGKKIVFEDGIEEIHSLYFGGNESLKEIVLPSTLKFAPRAFEDCNALEKVTIPEGIEKIYDGMFAECDGLKHVVLPSTVTEISTEGFAYCDSLSDIKLNEGLTKIGESAFSGCLLLENIALPKSLESIGEFAFCDTTLEEVKLYENVNVVEADIFFDCFELRDVWVYNPDLVSVDGDNIIESLDEVDASKLTIHGKAKSTAAKMAAEEGFLFKVIK